MEAAAPVTAYSEAILAQAARVIDKVVEMQQKQQTFMQEQERKARAAQGVELSEKVEQRVVEIRTSMAAEVSQMLEEVNNDWAKA